MANTHCFLNFLVDADRLVGKTLRGEQSLGVGWESIDFLLSEVCVTSGLVRLLQLWVRFTNPALIQSFFKNLQAALADLLDFGFFEFLVSPGL